MSEEASLDEFSDTEAAVSDGTDEKIPDSWDEVSIINLCEMGGGSTPKKSNTEYWEDGEILWTTPKDFDGPRLKNTEDKITERGAEESHSKIYPAGTILLVVRSGVLRHTLPVSIVEKPTTVNQDLKALEPDREQVNTEYFFQALSGLSEDIRGSCKKTGTTVESIQTNVLEQYQIPVPPLEEQRKIATVLSTVDQAIQKTEEIENQVERVKSGAMQKLFTYGLNNAETQQIHIGEFPQKWRFGKVSSLANIEKGNTPSTDNDDYYGGKITWVTPDDLSDLNEGGNGKYIEDSGRKLTSEGVESASLSMVEPDSVMFTSRSYGIGRTAICTVPAATNQGITAFECKDCLDAEFLYYYLNHIMDYVVSISGGSTFPEISKSATGNIDVPVPEKSEQDKIVSILSKLDKQILHNRTVGDQLKRLKQGLMQDLLSGAVRTHETDIEVPEAVLSQA